jgi:hypothetical protein
VTEVLDYLWGRSRPSELDPRVGLDGV